MMLAQGGVSLPAGYTKIEYLESDGSQFIDTGFKPNNNTRVVMDVQLLTANPTIHQGVFGARSENTNQLWVLYHYTENAWAFRFGNNSTNHYISAGTADRVTIDTNVNTMTIGDTSVTATAATFTSAYTMWLLAFNNAGTPEYPSGPARIYSCQIYDNGTLVRDFIPAMNASGEAGLYDLKNDVWYALLPVVKPKVKNKITLNLLREYDTTLDGLPIVVIYGRLTSEEEVASDVTATIYNRSTGSNAPNSLTIKEGANGSFGSSLLGLRGDYYITSISPTEDDTYIYTF